MIDIIAITIIMLIIDGIYLSTTGHHFLNMVKKIQGVDSNINYYSAGVTYCIMILGLWYFVIRHMTNKNILESIFKAGILGLVVYGVFDFTNLALFNKYDLSIALIDTIWGSILFVSVTIIIYFINKYIRIL